MAHLLVFTRPSKGHLYPLVPVLGELSARGHRITAETLPGSRETLAPLGIETRDLPANLVHNGLGDSAQRSPLAALRAASRSLVDNIPAEIAAMRAAVAATHPDALLIDITSVGAQIFGAATGLPWASWSPMLLPMPSKQVPPFGLGLTPKPGPLGRLRDATVRAAMTRMWDEVLSDLNAARRGHGLEPLRHTLDYLAQPPLMLNFTARPFDDPRDDWPTEVHQIGPGLWAPPADRPAWLDGIDKPLALVTCSTEFQDDGELAQLALDALAGSGMYTVVTTGAVDPSGLTVPADARVERFLPHHLLLDRAEVVVSHGGMGITQKALAAGVPVCAVPFGRDQREVARRVVTNEAGVWVSKKNLNPARLRAGIDEAITRRAGARRVAAGFAAAGGPGRGADLLEQHLRLSAAAISIGR
nr:MULTISPECIES: nucleotide disphospho-sugar-binding domain-containing protein [unclassified Nocardia]